MSKLLSLYKLCPINNDILGVSADAERSSVICTLGKKIVYVIELSTQKNIKSWSSLDNFSSKVVYDFKRKQYVGVFSNIYMRFWDIDTEDINRVKKVKFHKPIHEIFNATDDRILVVYEDGATESLDCALASRKNGRNRHDNELKSTRQRDFTIESTQMGNQLFSFVKKVNRDRYFCFTSLDAATLAPSTRHRHQQVKLDRPGLSVHLMALTTMYSNDGTSHLVSIWSDARMFRLSLNLYDKEQSSIGALHTMINWINVRNDIAMRAISENCIAVYANNQNGDGSSIILYNMKYKVVQSRLAFKVYLSNFKLWTVNENLYLAMAQHLSAISFIVTADKLSSMLGSQVNAEENVIEKETINEDATYEDALRFDESQEEVSGMEFVPDETYLRRNKKKLLSGAKAIADSDEMQTSIDCIYRGDLVVEVLRHEDSSKDAASTKVLNSVDEANPIMSENFEYYCSSLERHGFSEIEITNKVAPILLKTRRTEDVGSMLKRYNHISERILVQIIKYLLSCPTEHNDDTLATTADAAGAVTPGVLSKLITLSDASRACRDKNIFLDTSRGERRDVLLTALCCAFDSTTIGKYVSSCITLNEMVQLMDHLYAILTADVLDCAGSVRGSLVEGDNFDLDTKLFEWFKLLIDSHYQQILLSKDETLQEKLDKWLQLINEHVRILTEMGNMRYTLVNIANNKPKEFSRRCNRWYTIERLELY